MTFQWIDFSGELEDYGTVEAGESITQQSFAGHLWVVSDESGIPIGRFELGSDDAIATLG